MLIKNPLGSSQGVADGWQNWGSGPKSAANASLKSPVLTP